VQATTPRLISLLGHSLLSSDRNADRLNAHSASPSIYGDNAAPHHTHANNIIRWLYVMQDTTETKAKDQKRFERVNFPILNYYDRIRGAPRRHSPFSTFTLLLIISSTA
jgi:hypothetical protein